MPTREEVLADIDAKITDKTPSDKVQNTEDGANRVLIIDYIDQEVATKANISDLGATAFSNDYNDLDNLPSIASKTSGTMTLNGTFQVLQYDVNSCSFSGGKAFLPTTTEIQKTIYVIAVSNNIEIRANEAGTNRMFETFNTFTASVTLLTNEMYRFTYIGFGGYWKAEKI